MNLFTYKSPYFSLVLVLSSCPLDLRDLLSKFLLSAFVIAWDAKCSWLFSPLLLIFFLSDKGEQMFQSQKKMLKNWFFYKKAISPGVKDLNVSECRQERKVIFISFLSRTLRANLLNNVKKWKTQLSHHKKKKK